MGAGALVVVDRGLAVPDVHAIDAPAHAQVLQLERGQARVGGALGSELQLQVLGLQRAVRLGGPAQVAQQVGLQSPQLAAPASGNGGEPHELGAAAGQLLAQELSRTRKVGLAEPGRPRLVAQAPQGGLQQPVGGVAPGQRLGLGLQAVGHQPALHQPLDRAAGVALELACRPGLARAQRRQH